jgi:hypothetical protein
VRVLSEAGCLPRATLLRDVPYTMLELGLYENFKTALRKYKKKEELTTWVSVWAITPQLSTDLPG